MHPAILPAALTFTTAAAMSCYVGSRREKSDLHWTLLALLGALMVWTCGTLCRFSVSTSAGLRASLHLLFLGVFATPPLWFALAGLCARIPRLAQRRDALVALMIPSALAYLALLTNDGHRLVMREVSFDALERGARAWAGPVFWAFLAWSYACVVAGIALYLGTAHRMLTSRERRRGLILALAALIPLATSSVYIFQWAPVRFDLTPASLVACLGLLVTAVFRYQLLESLPLARRDVIEHLREGVVMASASGVILDLNPAAEAILDRDAARLRGLTLADALAGGAGPEDAPALRASLEALWQSERPLVAELRLSPDRRVEISAACVRDRSGEPAGQFAVLRDRTAERRDERAARQSQKLQSMGTLAAGIAHEVNNPLAFIRANLSEIHRMGERVEECADRPGEKLARELVDLRAIAEETLDGIARIEKIVADMRTLAGARDEGFEPLDVNEAVHDALRLANLRRETGIEVRTRLAEDLPRVDGLPRRLVQALLNLVVNARHALQGVPGARLEVETRLEADGVAILVADNGPGIADAIQERIFDPFFTTKGPDEGSGLGLAIAFDILRDHGGGLEVRSRPGEGACFTARIPRHRRD